MPARIGCVCYFVIVAAASIFDAPLFAVEPVNQGKEVASTGIGANDWPQWRGPNRNGIAPLDQTPPLKWSETENVLWKTDIPGRGHGSPTVFGDYVFVPTAEDEPEVQSVICLSRKSGDVVWKTAVHTGGLNLTGQKSNEKSSLASSTIACDGERVFVNFLNDRAIYTTALGLDGKQIWQQKIDDYILHQGFGSSPAVYKSLVIVSADNKGGGLISALDRASGDFVWKVDRPSLPNYTSPIILAAAGRDQLLFTGCDLVTSLDPNNGTKLWESKGATTECVTSTVTDGNLVFSTGGYPRNHVAAIYADGSGKIAWEKNVRVYVPSLLLRDGYLFAVLDAGIASCWKCDTGETAWTNRLGGAFTSSPVLVGNHIYAVSETGRTVIFKADPKAFELVGDNQLGDEVLATPAICGGRIFMRLAKSVDGKRQEMLYCLGEAQ